MDEQDIFILDEINFVNEEFKEIINQSIKQKILDLEDDIKSNIVKIIVVGETKSGKSTFINVMLENKKILTITNSLTPEITGVKYLEPNVILFDIPGIPNIDEEMSDFIAQADIAVLIFDSSAPLKRTEKEFIEDKLIALGIDQILFIINKMDYIEEGEALELLTDVKNKLKKYFINNLHHINLFPLSATEALDKLEDLDNIKAELSRIISNINWPKRYQLKFHMILEHFKAELEQTAFGYQSRLKSLIKNIEQIKLKQRQQGIYRTELIEYIIIQEKTILAGIYKDLSLFRETLTMDMLEIVTSYNGADFKDFVEQHTCGTIKKNIQRWTCNYSPKVESTLVKLAQDLKNILVSKFEENIILDNHYLNKHEIEILDSDISIQVKDVSKLSMQAGIISATVAGALALIGANMVLPCISMAAMPTIHQKLLEGRLKEIKAKVRPELTISIDQSIEQLYSDISSNIRDRINQLKLIAIQCYEQLATERSEKLAVHLNKTIEEKIYLENGVQNLEYKLLSLSQIMARR
ncbi:MAG: hypothetical protein ATN31_03025 [Candidatus Epulonipiscioides saccharophilum]|nr:MAG: hypothetical protein ATN31_03025 [Epulopiscium sp. AS2M-Bin001]